jgi:putative flippase GtrA
MFEWLTRELFFKFIKFGVVGFSGVGVDFGTTFLGKEIIKIPKYIANAIGFSVAATSNYFLNRVWTFNSQNPNIGIEFSEFFMISMIGLAINTLILWILVTKFKKNFYLSKLFAIAFVTIWNFFANAFFTFV